MNGLPENLTISPRNPVPVWERPEVADAQLVLVRAQLDADARGKPPAPFAAFHRAMKFLTARAGEWFSMLDVGCGVGHYGLLCARHYPLVRYLGKDISYAMIGHAKDLLSQFLNTRIKAWAQQCTSFEDALSPYYDVVFVSQALEMTDDPFASLHLVLERSKKYVLLHRLRLAPVGEPTRRIAEPTYLGYMARNVVWNRQEILETVGGYGEILYTDHWEMSLTLIVEKP